MALTSEQIKKVIEDKLEYMETQPSREMMVQIHNVLEDDNATDLLCHLICTIMSTDVNFFHDMLKTVGIMMEKLIIVQIVDQEQIDLSQMPIDPNTRKH